MKTKPIIQRIKFDGLDAIELRTPALRVVALTAKGPRIAFWGRPGGDNLLLWKPGKYFRGEWELMGGHRLWAARPGADEAEETYATDNQPCTVKVSAHGFTVTGALDPAQKTRRGITVTATADGRITLDHFLRNESDMLWSGGLWALTCTVPSKKSALHAAARRRLLVGLRDDREPSAPGAAGTAASASTIKQFKLHRRTRWSCKPSGRENKRMLKADAGIIAMARPGPETPVRQTRGLRPGRQLPARHEPRTLRRPEELHGRDGDDGRPSPPSSPARC
jgi:hypothetical protein